MSNESTIYRFARDVVGALSRVTSGGRFLPVIDGLRCVAILAVVLYHLEEYVVYKHPHWDTSDYSATWLHRVLNVGGYGVPLFFAISGFILGLPFIESRLGQRPAVPLGRYYWRRVTRLEPPYLINLGLMCVLLAVVKGFSWDEMGPHLLASALYVHGLVYGTMSTINFVTWSLEVEVQFYLLAPLLAIIFYGPRRVIRRVLLAVTLGSLIAIKLWFGGPIVTSWTTALINHLDHFLVGFLLADVFATDWHGLPKLGVTGDVVAGLGWIGVLSTQLVPGWRPLLPLATFTALAGSMRGTLSHRLLTLTPVVLVGGMCYTIYLYHFAIISAVGRFLIGRRGDLGYVPTLLLQSAVLLPVVFVTSAVLFWLFEKPFMIWRGQGWPRWTWAMSANPTTVTNP